MTQKPTLGGLIMVGAETAPTCEDGVCEIPTVDADQ